MNRPVTRKLSKADQERVATLLKGRGHGLAKNPRNRYVAWEARTPGRSIFTLYTSGKLVSTVRSEDGEGLLIGDELDNLLGGAAPAARPAEPAARQDVAWLGGADETGTGELIGSALVAGALLPASLVPAARAVAGHVQTKASRTSKGWEDLGRALADLRPDGLCLTLRCLPNRLFDRYSKNALLDLVYIRVVGDLLAGRTADELCSLALALDDYGGGRLLHRAMEAWRARGLLVLLETKADDRHLAARLASVWARAARAREMSGLEAEIEDGPIGSGNAGNRTTLAWLRRRAQRSRDWPGYIKASFKTVRNLHHLEPVTKETLPKLERLLTPATVADLLAARLDVRSARWPGPGGGGGGELAALAVRADGSSPEPHAPELLAFLPILFGGVVLDASLQLTPEQLDALLDRETGLLSGWRVLIGPDLDPDEPLQRTLLRAHVAGVVHLAPTALADPWERARHHAALRLLRDDGSPRDTGDARLLLVDA